MPASVLLVMGADAHHRHHQRCTMRAIELQQNLPASKMSSPICGAKTMCVDIQALLDVGSRS
jgi:hypothetical protein